MVSAIRTIVASLVLYLAFARVDGSAEPLRSDDASIAPSEFLFAVDIWLDESAPAVPLGIRDGQTVAQVCVPEVEYDGMT